MTDPSRRLLLVAICAAPRETMRWILDQTDRPSAVPVVIAAMVSFSLRDFDVQGMSDAASALGLSAAFLIALAVVLAVVLVSIGFYFAIAAAAAAAGRMFLEGTGTYRDVRLAVGWGLAPQVWALLFRVPALLLWADAVSLLRGGRGQIQFGPVSVTRMFWPDVSMVQVVLLVLAELSFFVWYLVVGSKTLGEAQGFSSLRGLANLILAVVLPIVALLVFAAAAVLTFKN